MHELSIAMSILDIVRNACEQGGHRKVEKVRVRIGRASGVMSDALRFSFEAVKEGSVASAARLEIEEIPVGGRCGGCAAEFSSEEKLIFECPLCGSPSFKIERGHELEVVDLEVED